MYNYIFQTHKITVILFLAIYLIKTILLLANKKEGLAKFTKGFRVPEMIISTLFLLTGIYMMTQIPEIKPLLIVKIVIVLASIPIAVIAFKKANKALAILSLFLIIMAYGLAEMSKGRPSVITESEAGIITDGEELYVKNCASCHGMDGKLGLTGASDLSISKLDEPGLIEVITHGRKAMPPYKKVLSEEQIKATAQYIMYFANEGKSVPPESVAK